QRRPPVGVLYGVSSSMGKVKLVSLQPAADPRSLGERSDDELITLVRAGVQPALRVLAERHTGALIRFCAKFVVDTHVGQELAQQTWLQLWANRAAYEARAPFKVFLFTIARNLCRNELRRRTRQGSWVSVRATDTEIAAVPADAPHLLDAILVRER